MPPACASPRREPPKGEAPAFAFVGKGLFLAPGWLKNALPAPMPSCDTDLGKGTLDAGAERLTA